MDWYKEIVIDDDLNVIKVSSFVALIGGLLFHLIPLAILGCFFLLFIYANHYYLIKVGNRLIFENPKQVVKLFPDEQHSLQLKFALLDFLPILNGKLILTIDKNIEIEEEASKFKRELQEIIIPFSSLGKQIVEIVIPYKTLFRGSTKIKSLEIVIPHLFGFGKVHLFYKRMALQEILIYPLPKFVQDVEKIIPQKQGEFPFKNSYFDDASTIVGARQYADDPFNKIHWKASARSNSLQTKIHSKTTQYSWTILLDINQENFEEYVSGVTYFLEYLTVRAISFDMYVNIGTLSKKPYIHLPIGSGSDHLQKALEILARLNPASYLGISFERMISIINRYEYLSPFVIVCGDLQKSTKTLVKYSRTKKIEYYSIVRFGNGLRLQKQYAARREGEYAWQN